MLIPAPEKFRYPNEETAAALIEWRFVTLMDTSENPSNDSQTDPASHYAIIDQAISHNKEEIQSMYE